MNLPTKGEKFTELIEHLRLAEEAAAVLGHLHADDDKVLSSGWLGVSQLLNKVVKNVTMLATRGQIKWN